MARQQELSRRVLSYITDMSVWVNLKLNEKPAGTGYLMEIDQKDKCEPKQGPRHLALGEEINFLKVLKPNKADQTDEGQKAVAKSCQTGGAGLPEWSQKDQK